MSTPKIMLKITRANGHSSEVATTRAAPPTPAMLAAAEALLEFLSTGAAPTADDDGSDDADIDNIDGKLTPMLYWSTAAPPEMYVRIDVSDDRRSVLARMLKRGRVSARYRGYASCQICQQRLGSADKVTHGMTYPQGAEHYVTAHGVWTPECDELLRRRAASAP